MSKDRDKKEISPNELPTYKLRGVESNGLEGVPAAKLGRPRDRGVHRRVVECTRHLARQGLSYRDISFDAVSREAGVAKTTLYRWWDSKAELIREACFLDKLKCPDTGSLSDDLESLVRQEIAAQTGYTSRAIFAALVAELVSIAEESEVEVPCPYQIERCEMISQIFNNAIARGEW
ncbi:MAG: TetR/AcrR family transcriptional regulator, partial [Proteobacteria bacterium]|nr:TetR/AcrR family transcriptional regulator [Pseudomonadota bacterium]